MKKLKYRIPLLSLILLFISSLDFLHAQPKMQGNIQIDMKQGLFNCDLKLSNLPNLKNYKILLNKGMNVKYFKNDTNEFLYHSGFYNGKIRGEASEYFFINEEELQTELPSSFNVTYTGSFPIYANEYNFFDFKGMIAFNGKTLRATEQSKWYPVIYDEANDKIIDAYTYDVKIDIKSSETTSIFLNGSSPQKSKSTALISSKPFPLLLFVGEYNFLQKNGDYILNADIDKKTADAIFNNIEKIKDVLSSNMNKKFLENIYLINHTAINKREKGSSWGFNTFPAFAFAGLDFNKLLTNTGTFTDDNYKFFGHEFGHNYFGSNVMSGTLQWFWLESFAEYLSYNVIEDLCGSEHLKKTLINQANSLKNKEFIALSKITNYEQINGNYRYILGPLILKCFEDEFGRKKTNVVLQNLLEKSKNEVLTIDIWESSAIESGITKQQFESFKIKFLENDNFKTTVEKQILKKYG